MSFQILDGHCVKLRPGTNTALGEADDALGDNFGERVGAIYKTKGLAGVRERGRHFLDNVGVKGLVMQEWNDWHWFPAGNRYGSVQRCCRLSKDMSGK